MEAESVEALSDTLTEPNSGMETGNINKNVSIASTASGVGLAGVLGTTKLINNKKNKNNNKYIESIKNKKDLDLQNKEENKSFVEEYLNSNY